MIDHKLHLDSKALDAIADLSNAVNRLAEAIGKNPGTSQTGKNLGTPQTGKNPGTPQTGKNPEDKAADATIRRKAEAAGKEAEAAGKEAEAGNKKAEAAGKEDSAPPNCDPNIIKKDLINPIVKQIGKDRFREFVAGHVRPLLQDRFDIKVISEISKDMAPALYVTLRDELPALLSAFDGGDGVDV